MNIQFPAADACHAVPNYHGVIPGPSLVEKNVMAVQVEKGEDYQQHYPDPHSDCHSCAPDLVLHMQEKVMCHAAPNLQQLDLAFPHRIVSIGQDSHESHYEED